MDYYFNHVLLIGVGLIGGSLALNLKQNRRCRRITGIGRTAANLETARELGIIDDYDHDAGSHASNADLIVLAVPVKTACRLLNDLLPLTRHGSLITDVGSTKMSLMTLYQALLPHYPDAAELVGAHPIAGTEEAGAASAFPHLFSEKKCIITPLPSNSDEGVQTVRQIWEECGMDVITMPPDRHDHILAAISHLPHISAYSMVNAVKDHLGDTPQTRGLAAGGFRDTSRIASSSPEMWSQICGDNRERLLPLIDLQIRELTTVRDSLQANDEDTLTERFIRARDFRGHIIHGDDIAE